MPAIIETRAVLALAVIALGCIAGQYAPAAGEVSIVSTQRIALAAKPGPSRASHELQLSLYVFRGTRWSHAEIEAAVLRTARLLVQCDVDLSAAELHVLDGPQSFRVYSTAVSRALLRQLTVRKPAVFFVDGTDNQPAYDAEAIGRENSATRPELADTVWIAYGARDLPLALAHELVHVVSDSGAHSEEPGNLMATETSSDNTRLSDAQCERLRSRGEMSRLLKRRKGRAAQRRGAARAVAPSYASGEAVPQ